uniref:Coiled-coil domain containing 15 n=1 Tax=Amphilophus citrinellus TaxID=61819 RepID=A0A3Q0SC86_AMPCI
AEKRRENEESLQRFQDEVRHRVAQRAHSFKKRRQLQTDPAVNVLFLAGRMIALFPCVTSHSVTLINLEVYLFPQFFQSGEGMRQVRLRLAACRVIQQEETASELPGGSWNISPTRHVSVCVSHMFLFLKTHSSYEGVLMFRLLTENVMSQLAHLSLQRQSQFLTHRRQAMNIEREQVKENKQHRKHVKRTASYTNKEFNRKIMPHSLTLTNHCLKKSSPYFCRFIEALRAQMKERMSQVKLELPPLCCCASSFWDSHPDTCANNCVFYNNPKAYAQALHSALVSLDLQ